MIYADYAATTPTDPEVIKAMEPYYTEIFGNPSSLHGFGIDAAKIVDATRTQVIDFLRAPAGEVVFTSNGTESNNLAIMGVVKANRHRGNHIITTATEHPSVINVFKALEKDGIKTTYLPVGTDGLVDIESLEKALTKETILVSIHLVNSEIGVIQDIAQLAHVAHTNNTIFHTDACQAPAYLTIDVTKLGVDMLSFNSSKVYGPKGVGVLYIKAGTDIYPIMYGGGQQYSLKSGTENTAGIVGLAKALNIVAERREADIEHLKTLRDTLQSKIASAGKAKVNFADSPRQCNHLSISFDNIDAKQLVGKFNDAGIAVSAGSACSSRSQTGSYVLGACGIDGANTAIRITLGRQTTPEEIDQIAKTVSRI